jgi:hypothetical protein
VTERCRFVGTIVLGATIGLVGCATQPEKIQAASVSPLNYSSYDCAQIGAESKRIQDRVSALHQSLKQEANADAWQMGVGLVLFWPTLFFLEGGDGPQAAEYAQLKGEAEALQKAAVDRRCGLSPIPGTPTVQPVAAPAKMSGATSGT